MCLHKNKKGFTGSKGFHKGECKGWPYKLVSLSSKMASIMLNASKQQIQDIKNHANQ